MFSKIIETKFFKELQQLSSDEIFFVGGCVRDNILGKNCKDYDLVIRNIPINDLISSLQQYGKVDIVGKSFGVIKFWPNEIGLEEPLDISLPRTEISIGDGHKEFEIRSDEKLEIIEDLKRRDFTINTLLYNSKFELIDYFNGLQDLENGIIKIVSQNSFEEDPLRMMRALQFACRFNFTLHSDTWNSIFNNKHLIKTVSKERIFDEILKVVNKNGSLRELLNYFNDTEIGKELFNFRFDDELINNIKTEYDFWFVLSSSFLGVTFTMKNHKIGIGDFLKEQLSITNELVKLINLMHNFYVNNNRQNFLNLFNFDNGIICCNLLDFTNYTYIIKEGLPTKITHLNINGDDLMGFGLKGIEIGNMQKHLLDKVLNKQLINDKISLTTEIINIIK